MKINSRLEPLVREALSAVVKGDRERLARALGAFPDEAAMTEGVTLAVAITVWVLHDVVGHRPTASEVREVASKLAASEDWIEVDADEVNTALMTALDGRRADEVLPMDKVVMLPFVIAGYLLSAGRAKDQQWWEYLDRAEAAIEKG